MYLYHDKLVNSANDNKVDNKFYFYFSEALNYKHYQAFFVFFLFVLHYAGLDFIDAKNHNLNNHNWSCGVTLLKI